MKKLILFIIMILTLTGCTVNYELTIDKDSIKENILINAEDERDNDLLREYTKPVEAFIDSPQNSDGDEEIPGVEYYKMNKTSDEFGNYHLNLTYDFQLNDFKKDFIIDNSVSSFYYDNDNGELNISTGLNIKAFNLYNGIDSLNIKINFSNDYEIIDSNAQNRNGNTLTWYITYDDHKKSSINLKLKEKNSDVTNPGSGEDKNPTQSPSKLPSSNTSSSNINDKETNSNDIVIVVGALLAFTIFLVVIISFKNKK